MCWLPVRIALDIDGVLTDSMGRWVEVWNSRYGHPRLSVEDIREWDFWRGLGITQETFNEVFDEVWRGWVYLRPLEENIGEKVARLSYFGRLDIVSGRSIRHLPYVKNWLGHHGIKYDSIFLGVPSKSRLNHDVFIDDSPVEAVRIAETARYVLLRDQPWNRNVPKSKFIIRVRNLEEAFKKLAEEVFPGALP
ncbi:Nucleotidase [Candidatus Calditenuaceae archaeon HR02]|nr:Nucleotidase [Candidatus Calditenuaceae archaeon HR02]